MTRTLIAVLLATASFAAAAADYFVVAPGMRRAPSAPVEPITVSLSAQTLPQGTASVPYAGFNFKDLLVVKGDAGFTGAGVNWAVTAGTLPPGLTLAPDGSLSGQPSVAGRAAFTLTAGYKDKTGQQSYELLVSRRTAGISLTGLLAHYPLAPANLAAAGPALSNFNSPGLTSTVAPSANFAGAADLRAVSGFYNYTTGVVSGTGNVSVGAWVRTTSAATQRIVQQRSNGDDTSTIAGQFMLMTSSGRLCYLDGSNTAFGSTVCHTKALNDGAWHHVGFMRPSTGGVRLYVDGAGQSFSYPLRNYGIRPGLAIGYDQRDNSNGLTGGLADVWMFSRGLTDAEFAQAYSGSAPLQ